MWFCGLTAWVGWAGNSNFSYRPEKCAVVLWLRLFGLPELSCQLKFFISSREMGCGFVASTVWVAWVEQPTQIFHIVQRNGLWFCSFDCLGCLSWAANSNFWYRPEKWAVVLWLRLFGLPELSCLSCPQGKSVWFCGLTAWVGWGGNSNFTYRPEKCAVVL